MRKQFTILLLLLFACKEAPKTIIQPWVPFDESQLLAENAEHESVKMQFKLIQSKNLDKNELWKSVANQISDFSEEDYQQLKPLVLEQNIPTLQSHIAAGKLTYEKLTQWYLYRIVKFENDSTKALNAIISLNPNAVAQAKEKDKTRKEANHPIFGIPVLLKDNINTEGMKTTAGAHVLKNNETDNAFITERLLEKGAIILGKTNLSEWANFMCLGCPNGYSAIGGQTLNAYGPRKFDTGGSSSGSGVSGAANYAAVTVGTETSGSILSPSSKSSLVGLKPTIGLFSRSGIVPISSTLDTPGPMTKNVIDNAILLAALSGEDETDPATKDNPKNIAYWEKLSEGKIKGKRFGVLSNFLEDSLYKANVAKLEAMGGVTVVIEPTEVDLDGFGTLLRADMRIDLKNYLENYASSSITQNSVADVVAYNRLDSAAAMPYGQGRFEGILDENVEAEAHEALKAKIHEQGIKFFETPMQAYDLDFVLSVNNRNAGYAAAAKYPCLTIPMGYRMDGEPAGLTFIARPFEEEALLKVGYAYEKATKYRKMPENYQ